jgi:hypothetical protein
VLVHRGLAARGSRLDGAHTSASCGPESSRRRPSPQATRCQDASWPRGRPRRQRGQRLAAGCAGPTNPEGADHEEPGEARRQERHRERQVKRYAHWERERHPPEEPDVHESGHRPGHGHGHECGERPDGGDRGGETAPGTAARRRTDRRRPASSAALASTQHFRRAPNPCRHTTPSPSTRATARPGTCYWVMSSGILAW